MDKNPLLSDTCNVQCSDEDPHIIVYLAAGTMGANHLNDYIYNNHNYTLLQIL